jgi:hypothetical protein
MAAYTAWIPDMSGPSMGAALEAFFVTQAEAGGDPVDCVCIDDWNKMQNIIPAAHKQVYDPDNALPSYAIAQR